MTMAAGAAFPGRLRLRLFGIPTSESSFARRGFAATEPRAQARIETIGATFIAGYRAALLHQDPNLLRADLERVDVELRGFAYEGAAMGLALSDFFTPWRSRWHAFLRGAGGEHAYMMHVGAGWAWARLPVRIDRRITRLDPLLRWLAVDGYGFHQGYFHWRRYISAHHASGLAGYGARAFDQGLGRCLWFALGADPARIIPTMASFPDHRQPDLWSGIGLAATYAGGVPEAVLRELRSRAGPYEPELAQGSAFAAKARLRAGNPSSHTELATTTLCDLDAAASAALTDQMLADLPPDCSVPAYEVWRQRIQGHFRIRPA